MPLYQSRNQETYRGETMIDSQLYDELLLAAKEVSNKSSYRVSNSDGTYTVTQSSLTRLQNAINAIEEQAKEDEVTY